MNLRDIYVAQDRNVTNPVPLGITREAVRIYLRITKRTCEDIRKVILEMLVERLVLADHPMATELCLIATGDKMYAEPYVFKYETKIVDSWMGRKIMIESYRHMWGQSGRLTWEYSLDYLQRGIFTIGDDEDKYMKRLEKLLPSMTHPWVREKTIEYLKLCREATDKSQM